MIEVILPIFLANVILGLILQPKMARLRSLLSQLGNINLSFKDSTGGSSEPPIQVKVKESLRSYQFVFRQYELAYSGFKILVVVFFTLLFVLFGFAVAQAEYLWIRGILLLCGIGVIIWIARLILDEFPSLDKITSIDYLAYNFPQFHPASLVDASSFGLSIERGNVRGDITDKNDPLCLTLSMKLPVLGYKVFVIVGEKSSERIYFASYGPVTWKAGVNRALEPDLKTYYSFKIAEISPNIFKQFEADTTAWIFFFFPSLFSGDTKLHPCIYTTSLDLPKEEDLRIISYRGAISDFYYGEDMITFSRTIYWNTFKKWQLTEINATLRSDKSPEFVRKIILRFKKQFEKSNRIVNVEIKNT